jgi:hypothetical protein
MQIVLALTSHDRHGQSRGPGPVIALHHVQSNTFTSILATPDSVTIMPKRVTHEETETSSVTPLF